MNAPTVSLTVEVPLGDLSPESVREAVIEAAVEKVLGIVHYNDTDEDGHPVRRTDDRAYDEMRRTVQSLVEKRVRDVVEEKVPIVVDETLRTSFVPTNKYGERKGEPCTLREMIGDHAAEWLKETTDAQGRVGYNSDKSKNTRVYWAVKKEVDAAFLATIKSETDKIAAEIKTQMSGRINAAITEVVTRIVGTP